MSILPIAVSEASASLLKDFAVAMAIAAGGLVLARLAWQPPVLGYLLAGMLIGPYTLPNPLISNLDTIGLLAELGLELLLFGIGMELGWRRIRSIGFRVLVIGVVEISVLTLFGMWLASAVLGITGIYTLYLGGALAISSSAILLKGLRDSGGLRSGWGQTIVGILLVEDFAAVIFLTVLSGLAVTGSANLADAALLAGKLGLFCVAVLILGTLLAPRLVWLMRRIPRAESDESMLVASLGVCFVMALCASLLGLSGAAGAFLIGVVIGDTEVAGRVTRLVNPVRDMFGALFFLSIGMLIDYRTIDDYIVPALVVVGVFMTGKAVANIVGSILSGRSPRTAVQVGMTMPQMGEFSLAIGRVAPTEIVGLAALGPILAIATAITSALAPLTSRIARPMCLWVERNSPATLHQVNLSIQLGVDTFWSALSVGGPSGRHLHNLGRRMLVNLCIVAVITAAGTIALYALPNVGSRALQVSPATFGLIVWGAVVVCGAISSINIWRELRMLAQLATVESGPRTKSDTDDPLWQTLRSMVQNGLATAFLALLLLLSAPLIIRLYALGSLSAPLSALFVLAPAATMGFIAFRVHRVLEPAFSNLFPSPSGAETHAQPQYEFNDHMEAAGMVEESANTPIAARHAPPHPLTSDAPRRSPDVLVATAIEHLDEEDELWQLLEERIALLQENGEAHLNGEGADRESPDRERRRR